MNMLMNNILGKQEWKSLRIHLWFWLHEGPASSTFRFFAINNYAKYGIKLPIVCFCR